MNPETMISDDSLSDDDEEEELDPRIQVKPQSVHLGIFTHKIALIALIAMRPFL